MLLLNAYMVYKFSHQQKFQHKMTLTPQMRQSINLLGMSIGDLNEYIDFAMTQNPFLQKLVEDRDRRRTSHNNSPSTPVAPESSASDLRDTENPRLKLLSQIQMSGASDKDREIAEYLVFEMDENGYIKTEAEEAAEDLGVSRRDVARVISMIQEMDPAGIGARDITECLQIQLRRAGKEDSLAYEIVSQYLGEVAQDNIEKIARSVKADRSKVREAVTAIKKLNPRPASTILAKEADKVIPELMAKVDRGAVRIEVNRGAMPGLKLYNPYENNLDIIKDAEARQFLKDNMGSAKSLIDSLKRREETICKVADHILSYQKDAISLGKGEIRSLTIRDIAKAVKLHPSTISRTVSKKFVQINGKVVKLDSLLSHGIKNSGPEAESKTAVKKRIEAIVKREDPSSPLSDADICRILKGEHAISLNRRTLTKYRQSMRILPSHLRRKR